MKVVYIILLSSFYFFSNAMDRRLQTVPIDEQTVRRSHHIVHLHQQQQEAADAMYNDDKKKAFVPDVSTSTSSNSEDNNNGQFDDVEFGKKDEAAVGSRTTKPQRLSMTIRLGQIDPEQSYRDMAQTSVELFFGENHQMQCIIDRVHEKIKEIHTNENSPREHKEQLEKLYAVSSHRKSSRNGGQRASDIVIQIGQSHQQLQPVLQTQQPQILATTTTHTPAQPASPESAQPTIGSALSTVIAQGVPLAQQLVAQALQEHNAAQTQTISRDQIIKIVSWGIGAVGTLSSAIITWLITNQTTKH